MIGRFVGLILAGCVAEWWAKHGVEAIIMLIKRKWSELCRKRMRDADGIGRSQVERHERRSGVAELSVKKKKQKLTKNPFLKSTVG